MSDMSEEGPPTGPKLTLVHSVPAINLPLECEEMGIRIENGRAVTDSRTVAAKFEKRHDHVLRDIANLLRDLPECAPSFGETYIDVDMPNGGTRQERVFVMNRDGFSQLAMTFTGAKARRWQYLFIQAFNAIEKALVDAVHGRAIATDPRVIMEVLKEASAGISASKDALIAHGQALATHGHMLGQILQTQAHLGQRVDETAQRVSSIERVVSTLPAKRNGPTPKTRKRLIEAVAKKRRGYCPCCGDVEIVRNGAVILGDDGKPIAEVDHHRGRSANRFEDLWLICIACHTMVTDGCATPEGAVITRNRIDPLFLGFHGQVEIFSPQIAPPKQRFFGELAAAWPIAPGDGRWIKVQGKRL